MCQPEPNATFPCHATQKIGQNGQYSQSNVLTLLSVSVVESVFLSTRFDPALIKVVQEEHHSKIARNTVTEMLAIATMMLNLSTQD